MTDSVDMRSIISEILRNGKIDGFIPMDEIKRVQSDYDLSNEKVEEILQKIRAANIDLIARGRRKPPRGGCRFADL